MWVLSSSSHHRALVSRLYVILGDLRSLLFGIPQARAQFSFSFSDRDKIAVSRLPRVLSDSAFSDFQVSWFFVYAAFGTVFRRSLIG